MRRKLVCVVAILLVHCLCSTSTGQYPKFEDLFDQACLDRAHLSEKLQFDYTAEVTVDGLVNVAQQEGRPVEADVLRTTEEVGRWYQDSTSHRSRYHLLRKIVSVEEFVGSGVEKMRDQELGLHALLLPNESWLALGDKRYRRVDKVETHKVPRCFADFPIDMLPFLQSYNIISHGERKEITLDAWANADVVDDEVGKDGNRELLLLFNNRLSGARVILDRPDSWKPKSIECLGSFGNGEIYPHDPDLKEKMKTRWKSYSTIFVDWRDITFESGSKLVPYRLRVVARASSGKKTTTIQALFGNWKFGQLVLDDAFDEDNFRKAGIEGIDFLKIRNDVTGESAKYIDAEK